MSILNSILLQGVTVATDTLQSSVDAGGAEGEEQTLTIWQMLFDKDGLFIMIPLVILFVLAIYLFIERFLAITRASKEDPTFMAKIKDFVLEGKIDSAKSLCASTAGPFARMLSKGLNRIGKPLPDISEAIENDGKLEIFKLENNLATLATIAGAAPMIGFLGTVIGMISTFHEMYRAGNQVEISDMSGGIMMAMITTATGLVVGIIAYIGYNFLVAKVEKVIHKMEANTISFMDVLNEPA